ncbi:MAG: penicillin-binding transpeptidase domain-containing protein, partial [Alphaproteobacteria bacterium]|nr:penicillin-binding transpeptidase domain-containing protein [Alphaproteobacteria bacterium]
PTKAWKKRALKQSWHLGETLIAGIGQGFVLATPMQLAVMTSRIVNGGKAVTPRLTRQIFEENELLGQEEDVSFEDLGIPANHLKVVVDAMDEVVNHPKGTARGSRIEKDEWEMGGKTGTSQVRRISEAEREAGIRKGEDIAWRLRDHALFVGFAPVHKPRFVTAVIVEHGGGGSKAAAPIAKDVLLKAQELMGSSVQVTDREKEEAEG